MNLFYRLHLWLHGPQGWLFTWPDWWCSVLNVLGRKRLCVDIAPGYRAHRSSTPRSPVADLSPSGQTPEEGKS